MLNADAMLSKPTSSGHWFGRVSPWLIGLSHNGVSGFFRRNVATEGCVPSSVNGPWWKLMGTGNIIDGDFVLSRHEGWRMRAVVQFTTCRDSFQEFQSHAQQATPGRIEMHISMCAHGLSVLSREVGYLTLFPHFHLWIIKMLSSHVIIKCFMLSASSSL